MRYNSLRSSSFWQGDFSCFIRFVVGNKSKILFCHDGDQSLKNTSTGLFRTFHSTYVYVPDHYNLLPDSSHWCVNFVREPNDQELDLFTTYFDLLYSCQGDIMAKIKWSGVHLGKEHSKDSLLQCCVCPGQKSFPLETYLE